MPNALSCPCADCLHKIVDMVKVTLSVRSIRPQCEGPLTLCLHTYRASKKMSLDGS